MSLVPMRPALLLLMRGESFREGGHHSRELTCQNAGRQSQAIATESHRTLVQQLAGEFELELALHTYELPGCSIYEMYAGWSGVPAPRVYFYNHSAFNQSALWREAWRTELRRSSRHYAAALAVRFDVALWNPQALGHQIADIVHRLDANSRDLWVPHAVSFPLKQHIEQGRIYRYFCECYAFRHTSHPYIADSMQLIAQNNFQLMSTIFPGHDTVTCLASHAVVPRFLVDGLFQPKSEECRNPLYFLVARKVEHEECVDQDEPGLFDAYCSTFAQVSPDNPKSCEQALDGIR